MGTNINADQFIKRLSALRSPGKAKARSHLASDGDDVVMGVRMGQVFALAKEFMDMPLDQVEKLLESPIHEVRVGAVSIMDFQARSKKTGETRRKQLFDLYIRRHDRINTWDLVDRSAPYVVGEYLFDKPRKILYKLAKSKQMPERRTAIVSTLYFVGKGDVAERREVKAGAKEGRLRLIESGLRPEEWGITSETEVLRPGERVEPRRTTPKSN